jgi:ferredoxin
MGMCGCDVVRIVQGGEHLDEPSAKEIKTLQRKGLEPGPYRLACVTHASGPITVEVVD